MKGTGKGRRFVGFVVFLGWQHHVWMFVGYVFLVSKSMTDL